MSFLDNHDLMVEEWRAWRTACAELEALGIDINEQERLHAALVLWGELLVALRQEQEPAVHQKALEDMQVKFRSAGLSLVA